MMITADEALGIPCHHPGPFGRIARAGVFVAVGLVAAALLFLLDSVLVRRSPYEQEKATSVKLVEFVRVATEDEVRIRERTLPPKPKPLERPDRPEKVMANQRQNVQQMEIDFEMPDVESGLAGGAGPWLGAYVPRKDNHGMHDGDILPIVRIEPQYPREALVKGIEGWVRVQFTILEDGGVEGVEVLAADPRGMFERNAVRAVMRWKFKPRIVDGQPVRRLGAQTIEFQLLEDAE